MPYDNAYNRKIAHEVRQLDEDKIKNLDMIGGSGFARGSFMDRGDGHVLGAGRGVKSYIKKIKHDVEGGAILGGSRHALYRHVGMGYSGGVKRHYKCSHCGGAKHSARGACPHCGAGTSGGGVSGGRRRVHHRMAHHGGSFFGDLWNGVKSVARVAAPIASVLPIGGPLLRAGLGAIAGAGRCRKCGMAKRPRVKCMHCTGMGYSGGRHLVPVANMRGVIGGRRRVHRARGAGTSGGARHARAQIVRKIMRERGVSLPVASSIVKHEGLY